MNDANVFRHIGASKRDLVIGMECGNSMLSNEGEQAFIDAYRETDPG